VNANYLFQPEAVHDLLIINQSFKKVYLSSPQLRGYGPVQDILQPLATTK